MGTFVSEKVLLCLMIVADSSRVVVGQPRPTLLVAV